MLGGARLNRGLTPAMNFQNFGNALIIVYRMATNDGWESVYRACAAEGQPWCPSNLPDAPSTDLNWNFFRCGNRALATIYFVSFGIFGTLVMINLFIAVIIDTYFDNIEIDMKMKRLAEVCICDRIFKIYIKI